MNDGMLESLADGVVLNTEDFSTDHYVDVKIPKVSIVLHQTEGWAAQTSFEWLVSQYSTVMVPFFVDRDGTVYQTYPCDRWAYHLGRGVPTALNKDSIPIEIANLGALVRSGDDLIDDVAKKRICSLDETDKYYAMATPYRGVLYFEANPEPQLKAVCALVSALCEEFSIPQVFCDDPWIYDPKFAAKKFSGVYHHAKVRIDKVDIHPAFRVSDVV